MVGGAVVGVGDPGRAEGEQLIAAIAGKPAEGRVAVEQPALEVGDQDADRSLGQDVAPCRT